MKHSDRISSDGYSDIEYHQFTQPPVVAAIQRIAGILCWPLILPMAGFSRVSDFIFRTCSELLSIVPYLFGVIMRYEFYRLTLTRCGRNVSIGFGTILFYRDIEIGDHVNIGNYNVIHYCDFGSYVLISDLCQFLSGSRYHHHASIDKPMALQGGKLRRIAIHDDTWIGAGAIVMNDVKKGGIVGAGAVVTKPVAEYTIVAGNPARPIRRRK